MKIYKTFIYFSLLLCLGLSVGQDSFAASRPPREYNCKMPPRRECPSERHCHNNAFAEHPLFYDLGLSKKRYDYLVKLHSHYEKNARKIAGKMCNARPGKEIDFRNQFIRNEESFLKEVRHNLSPSQYRIFEKRFRNFAISMPPASSAPRPGAENGLGNIVKGPDPILMTGSRRNFVNIR